MQLHANLCYSFINECPNHLHSSPKLTSFDLNILGPLPIIRIGSATGKGIVLIRLIWYEGWKHALTIHCRGCRCHHDQHQIHFQSYICAFSAWKIIFLFEQVSMGNSKHSGIPLEYSEIQNYCGQRREYLLMWVRCGTLGELQTITYDHTA